MANLQLIFIEFPAIAISCLLLVGAIFGSFINMLSYRIPQQMEKDYLQESHDLISHLADEDKSNHADLLGLIHNKIDALDASSNLFTVSHCPKCKRALKWWHNIPLLSYLFLLGKCGHCKVKIPKRYFVTEVVCALLTLLCYWQFGYSALFLSSLVFVWTLITLAVIDLETTLLPDQLTLPLVWLGLLAALLDIGHVDLPTAVVGAIVGYLSLYCFYWIAKLLTGKEGFGYGDFKLLAAVGAWIGATELLGVLLISCVSALVFGLLFFKVKPGEPFPFGPYLVIGALLMLFTQNQPLFSALRLF